MGLKVLEHFYLASEIEMKQYKSFILIIFYFLRATSKSICENLSPREIIVEFESKPQQKPAIICAINEIYQSNYWISEELKNFLTVILSAF
jgi:uncharacterized membrane protein